MNYSKKSGQAAEDTALAYLKQHGLALIHKNFISRFGEIDLIMRDNDTLVFVEVRKRHTGIRDAIESITNAKQRKLVKSAQYYLLKTGFDVACRFDAVLLDNSQRIEWLKNIIVL